ncbi:VOC family protein [Actinotalea sp. M2MS4P-6]|uniref:VOC family protein n=1 Tax=Actinotalea sp. M2MS4P-6 TaxID=2983762 RepID=UPI0021E3746E|nr:VOC family protein [Actinotalea sp. M2MS4P-6]MCV2393624.1 VOC family protein [Actinotalea sp. M2MS4P-6]
MAHGDITHIEIPVTDKAKAASFYGAMFGWNIQEAPGFEGYPMWQAPNKLSGGGLVDRTAENTQPVSYVEVDSIDELLAKVVALGGSVAHEKMAIDANSSWAAVVDPDGNTIGLYEGAPASEG